MAGSDHRLVDLVLLMGNYAATAALLTAFDMQLPADRPPLLRSIGHSPTYSASRTPPAAMERASAERTDRRSYQSSLDGV